jgi:chromosome segregation ATPase
MEEQNEIVAAMNAGFERIDQRLGRIEGDVSTLKGDVSVLKEDVSVLKTDMAKLQKDTRKAAVKLEFLIDKADLIKENVVDMRGHLGRYSTEVEHPLEQRVTRLEGKVWTLEQKK